MRHCIFIARFSALWKSAATRTRKAASPWFSSPHPAIIDHAKAELSPCLELTYNWDTEDYTGGRNFGHLAYEVDDIYATCQHLMDNGVTINRPPRDGHMAFVRSPDGISIEILQKGGNLPPQEPWLSMGNTGAW